MKSQLKKLNDLYSLYQPFWTEWIRYKHCKLTEKEVAAINFLFKCKFSKNVRADTEFSIGNIEIQDLTAKLKRIYNDYQEWAILRFQFVILNYMYKDGKKLGHTQAIEDLPLDLGLIEILLKFKSETLEELIEKYTEMEFKSELVFANILQFMARYLKANELTHEPTRV